MAYPGKSNRGRGAWIRRRTPGAEKLEKPKSRAAAQEVGVEVDGGAVIGCTRTPYQVRMARIRPITARITPPSAAPRAQPGSLPLSSRLGAVSTPAPSSSAASAKMPPNSAC